jgi:hypothetical protein
VYIKEIVAKDPAEFHINSRIPLSIPISEPASKKGIAYERRLVDISKIVSGLMSRNWTRICAVAMLAANEIT